MSCSRIKDSDAGDSVVRHEPATPWSRSKHSTTEPLLSNDLVKSKTGSAVAKW